MTNALNHLPIAIHHESGGDARVRVGGTSVSLNGISSGSFQVTAGTRYRLFANLRTSGGCIVLVSYQSPASIGNASAAALDLGATADDVPEGTTVYFTLYDAAGESAATGGANDYLVVSIYG